MPTWLATSRLRLAERRCERSYLPAFGNSFSFSFHGMFFEGEGRHRGDNKWLAWLPSRRPVQPLAVDFTVYVLRIKRH
jgi:hypothetical protein